MRKILSPTASRLVAIQEKTAKLAAELRAIEKQIARDAVQAELNNFDETAAKLGAERVARSLETFANAEIDTFISLVTELGL